MEATAMTIPDNAALQREANDLVELAKAIEITTQYEYARAGELRAGLRALDKKMEARYKPIKQKQDEAKKAILDAEKADRSPLAEASRILDPKLVTWEDEQERLRREKQRRLQEIERKRAEKEAKAEAKALDKEGRHEEAVFVRETPVEPLAVVLRSETPKVAGLIRRANWKWECANFKAVLAEVMEGRQPASILQINDKVVGEQVRSLGDPDGKTNDFRCAGIRVWAEKTR